MPKLMLRLASTQAAFGQRQEATKPNMSEHEHDLEPELLPLYICHTNTTK